MIPDWVLIRIAFNSCSHAKLDLKIEDMWEIVRI